MSLTILSIPTDRMRNTRDPIDGAPRCQSLWMLRLDEDGEVDVFCRDYYGGDGVPEKEWHQRTLTWGFGSRGDCSVVDANRLKMALDESGGELLALLERVHAGHSVDWNGNNYVGELDQDADEASDEIESMLADGSFADTDAPELWDAYDWLTGNGSQTVESTAADLNLTATSTDEEKQAAVNLAITLAGFDNVELDDPVNAIETLVERLRVQAEEEAYTPSRA